MRPIQSQFDSTPGCRSYASFDSEWQAGAFIGKYRVGNGLGMPIKIVAYLVFNAIEARGRSGLAESEGTADPSTSLRSARDDKIEEFSFSGPG
jgi:hypothetical protein